MDFERIRELVTSHDQQHLLRYWEELNDAQRAELVADIEKIDFEQLARVIPTHVLTSPEAEIKSTIEPAPSITPIPGSPEYKLGFTRGAELIKAGKVASMLVAGGQGTRLGFDGPKGMYPITPIKNKTLFQVFAEGIQGTQNRFGGIVPWYIMTSELNNAPTQQYFEENNYFGLDKENVILFQQGMMPAVDTSGKILLDQKHRIAMSPDGHGGSLRALAVSGALADMKKRGVEQISYFQVDNPLVNPADPVFIGLHVEKQSEASSIAVPKRGALEKVGNFARVDGKVCVIEYSDLPEELAHATNPDGSRKLDAGSIAIHVFSRSFIERLTEDIHAIQLPWHRAVKKVPYVEISTGSRIEPSEPNGVKLEMFVFDTLPLADNSIVVNFPRLEVFSPVKNAEGTDSPASTREDLIERAGNWLEKSGVEVPRTADGKVDAVLEISPLKALDAEQLSETRSATLTISAGEQVYIG